MSKFKVGDRVAIYGTVATYSEKNKSTEYLRGDKGTVQIVYSNPEDELTVKMESREISAHPKQCRKLMKKERKRLWIKYPSLPTGFHSCMREISNKYETDWFEFIEVKK